MPTILVAKTIKELAKKHGKQCGKDFIELYDRKIYDLLEKKIISVHQKRLTKHDII